MPKNEIILKDITSRIEYSWTMWREATGVVYDKKVHSRRKESFIRLLYS